MSERLSISFADADHQIQGVAIAGAGTLLKVARELITTPAPLLSVDGSDWRLRAGDACELTIAQLGSADAGGLTLARATGTVGSQPLDGLAILDRAGGTAAEAVLERSLAILFDAQLAFALRAQRPSGAGGHGEEQLAAVVFRSDPPQAVAIEKPRLSSSYDAAGRLTHAGIELWETEDSEFPLRIGGEAIAAGELPHADGTLTQVTFVAWHHEGRRGLGSYTIAQAA